MAALRDIARDFAAEIRDGIGWTIVYRTGRSWNALTIWSDIWNGEWETDDLNDAIGILKADPDAVIVNGYYCGHFCSPCRGDYENNIKRAKEYSRAAVEKGVIPVTPHIYLTQFMDDNVPEERELALKIGSELVLGCSELWAFGIDHPSAGMAAEIELAKAHGIPVRNGFEAISELKPDEEPENSEEDKPDIGSVTLHLPAFRAMAVCNQHLDHGPISIELDGSVILELADRLISDPGVHIEIGG